MRVREHAESIAFYRGDVQASVGSKRGECVWNVWICVAVQMCEWASQSQVPDPFLHAH